MLFERSVDRVSLAGTRLTPRKGGKRGYRETNHCARTFAAWCSGCGRRHGGGRSRRNAADRSNWRRSSSPPAARRSPCSACPFRCPRSAGTISRQRSLESLSAVGQTVPNLLFGERGASGRGSAVVYIRGVGQADVRPTYDPAVGVYVDGVFLGRMQGNDLDTMDVERVEVLRGPQGTLFGKNTSGGALNIVTRQPDLENYRGKVQLTGGSRSRFDALGSLNIPLARTRLRCWSRFAQNSGWLRNARRRPGHGRHRSHIRHGSHCACNSPTISAPCSRRTRSPTMRRTPCSSSSRSIPLRRRSR